MGRHREESRCAFLFDHCQGPATACEGRRKLVAADRRSGTRPETRVTRGLGPGIPTMRNLFRRRRINRDIDRELRFHLAERADDLEAAGMSRADALLSARRRFGNPTLQAERTRDMDLTQWFESTLRNLRHAARALWKAP